MSDRVPGDRAAQRSTTGWGTVAIAIGLGLVMLVIMRGLTGQVIATWAVASAVGVVIFMVAQAARRRPRPPH